MNVGIKEVLYKSVFRLEDYIRYLKSCESTEKLSNFYRFDAINKYPELVEYIPNEDLLVEKLKELIIKEEQELRMILIEADYSQDKIDSFIKSIHK